MRVHKVIRIAKCGLVELVDIDICSNNICSNRISTNYYGGNGGVRMETYYVVEVNGRYYENETVLYSDNEIFEHSVRTTKSLLECKRFYSKEDAQETADKHGFVVRKVIVECE